MDSLFLRLGNLLLGEPEEETEEQRAALQRLRERRQLQAKSQRAVLLEDLELAVQALALFVDAKGGAERSKPDDSGARSSVSGGLLLNDELTVVNLLCLHIDRCVRHGLRPLESDDVVATTSANGDDEAGDQDTVKFFGVVKWTCTRVESLRQRQMLTAMHQAHATKVNEVVATSVEPDLPRQVRGFVAAARAASALASVRTDEGKARAFVRQALNMHVLTSAMSMVLGEGNMDLLSSYYSEVALFRQRDDVKVFLSLISALDSLPFAFLIDDTRLDEAPDSMPFSASSTSSRQSSAAVAKKREAPKLIDPEDMVLGRVRLYQDDEETAMLAEKLVAHHELRPAFDSARGGNLLSDTLKIAAQSRKLDDAATAVLRFLELGYPEYDVFGTELIEVLCNPFLSGMARFEPALGLPDVVEACFCYLYAHLDSPGLFQVHLDASHVIELRDSVEELGGFHKDMMKSLDTHEVTALLLQYLWEMPDPLLTSDRLNNFLACADSTSNTMSDSDRRSLLKMLIDDLPWYCKPLVERLCHWAAMALRPQHARKNGLTIFTLANALAPVILRESHEAGRFRDELDDPRRRKYPVGYQHRRSVRRRMLDDLEGSGSSSKNTATKGELGAQVVARLLEDHIYVMRDFRVEMRDRRGKLKDKVVGMEALRFRLEEPIDQENPAHASLLLRLWRRLLLAEEGEEADGEEESDFYVSDLSTTNSEAEQSIDVAALLGSKRWARSGFHTDSPLGGFRGGGLLSLESLVFFLEKYPDKSAAMMKRNALPGGQRYPFPVASINVLRMMLRLLMLDEPPAMSSKLVLRHDLELEEEIMRGEEEESKEDEQVDGEAKAPATRATVLRLRVAERVSRAPFWRVFDDINAFYKLHAMAFMLLDLHWLHSGATQMGFQPVLDATRRQMGWLLEQAPRSVEEMWTTWMRVREQDAAKRSGGLSSVVSSVMEAFGGSTSAPTLFAPGALDEKNPFATPEGAKPDMETREALPVPAVIATQVAEGVAAA